MVAKLLTALATTPYLLYGFNLAVIQDAAQKNVASIDPFVVQSCHSYQSPPSNLHANKTSASSTPASMTSKQEIK